MMRVVDYRDGNKEGRGAGTLTLALSLSPYFVPISNSFPSLDMKIIPILNSIFPNLILILNPSLDLGLKSNPIPVQTH